MDSSATSNPPQTPGQPAQNGFPPQLMRAIGLLFAWCLFPLALQRVLYPSLGTLKKIFIFDAILLVSLILIKAGEGTKNLSLLIVGSLVAIVSFIGLLIPTINDIEKLYRNKVS